MSTHPASDRLNESLKRLHDLQDHARVHGERVLYARSAIKQSFVDGYAKKELSLIFHAQVSSESDVIGKGLVGAPRISSMDDAALVLQFDAIDVPVRLERNQEAVFVSFVENVNFPNGKIPSLVRAYFVKHQIEKPRTGDVYFSPSQGSFKLFAGAVNGKFGEVAQSRGSGNLNSFDPRIIEGAFEIVNSIANHQGSISKEPISVHDVVNESLVGKIRVNLDARNVTIWQVGEPFSNSPMCLSAHSIFARESPNVIEQKDKAF